MSDEENNIINLSGGTLYENHRILEQLFSTEDVAQGALDAEVTELVVIGRTKDNSIYVGGSHSIAIMSLLIHEAVGLLFHRKED